jgi:hypothetical protein
MKLCLSTIETFEREMQAERAKRASDTRVGQGMGDEEDVGMDAE